MRRHVVAAALTAVSLATAEPLAAQAIQGPTYRVPDGQTAASFELTSWTAPAGIGGIDTPLYYHWFTGTLTLLRGFGTPPIEQFLQHTSGTIFYEPAGLYTGCAACAFTYAANASGNNGLNRPVTPLSNETTLGRIPTTYPGFLVPIGLRGSYGYEYWVNGRIVDRENFTEIGQFVLVSPAPTVTPEPATWALLGGGLLALAVVSRRRRGAA